jgi:DNA polymerase-3 subunit epsilon
MALILESQEIRRLWPEFNRSQKKYHHKYGLYTYEDTRGYLRLVIEKKRVNLPAIYTFDWLPEGQAYIRKISGTNDQVKAEGPILEDSAIEYNNRIRQAIADLHGKLPSFVLIEKDYSTADNYAVYLVEKGRFYGMGYSRDPFTIPLSVETWKAMLEPSPDNDYIRGLLYQFADKKYVTRLNLQD